jgi:hypothetical protein
MFTNNKSVCAQRQETDDPTSTAKGSTTTGVMNTEPNLRNTNVPATQACPNLNKADYEAAQILHGMRYSLPDSDSTISAPNSAANSPSPTPPNEADHEAAQVLLDMRYSLLDSDSTISAPNSAANSPPTSPSNGKISVQEHIAWKASGIKNYADYLAWKND